MVNGFTRVVIWSHSECRSTAALYRSVRELGRARGLVVDFCLRGLAVQPEGRRLELPDAVRVGDDYAAGAKVLAEKGGPGTVQVFCVYQNSSVWRRLIVEARRGGARVVVYAEAPCEMCLGFKALVKRLYYRLVLPWRLGPAIRAADLFISQSGTRDFGRLLRLGWRRREVVPFGYVSPRLGPAVPFATSSRAPEDPLRLLHLGSEAPYRDVATLELAVARLRREGIAVELTRTAGARSPDGLLAAIRSADAVVACGRCEPWGMRVNDALLEGVPVVVSDGMGARDLCRRYGCGLVFRRGDAADLAAALRRLATDSAVRAALRAGAVRAASDWTPDVQAGVWLDAVLGGRSGGARTILHVSSDWGPANGVAVAARLLAEEQSAGGGRVVRGTWFGPAALRRADEVWIHCGWKPCLWWAALWARKAVWMPHGCEDPVRLAYHGWKKRLAGPVERWALRRVRRIVTTCAAERDWVTAYLGGRHPFVEVTDLRRFFALTRPVEPVRGRRLLYLGRRHPLKGLDCLERAVAASPGVTLRVESAVFGEARERAFAECDVVVLPTLSENFGLVVAEALARGRPVVTTDGAPAWADQPGVVYLRGYRDGTDEDRVRLLRSAFDRLFRPS